MPTELQTYRTMYIIQDEWTYQLTYNEKCISSKCIGLFDFLARLLTYTKKCIEKYRISSCLFFSHLLTYLGPLYQLKGVSASAEKRVATATIERGLSTERAILGTFRGFGTERAKLGTFRGFGTERARLGTLKKSLFFVSCPKSHLFFKVLAENQKFVLPSLILKKKNRPPTSPNY